MTSGLAAAGWCRALPCTACAGGIPVPSPDRPAEPPRQPLLGGQDQLGRGPRAAVRMLVQDAGIGVRGEHDARVPEQRLDELEVIAGRQRQTGRAVPQIVQANRRQSAGGIESAEQLGEPVRVHRPVPIARKQERGRFDAAACRDPLRTQPAQHGQTRLVQCDDPVAGLALRPDYRQASAGFAADLAGHDQHPRGDIDVAPLQVTDYVDLGGPPGVRTQNLRIKRRT